MDSFPASPETGADLAARWAARDATYARMADPLEPAAAEAIRAQRMREASLLPSVRERGALYTQAKTWMPPFHPEEK